MPTEVFSRTTPGHGTVGLTVTDGRMTLFSAVPIDPEAITLDITVATRPVLRPHSADAPDAPVHEVRHDLTTQWLSIRRSDLSRRDAGALDGFALDWSDSGDWRAQPPAAVYDGSYGMVSRFAMTLTHLDGARYRLRASGQSEFDEGFTIDCSVTLEQVMLRPDSATTDAQAEAALAGLFDVRGDWKTPGNPNATWRDLVARFGD